MKGLYKNTRKLEFNKIFDDYKHQVYNYAYSIAKSDYAAEEITQEVFIKLWKSEHLLTDVKNLNAYIYTISKNYALNHLRKATSDLKLTEEVMRVTEVERNTTDSDVQVSEYRKLIHSAICQLSPQRRLVYQLKEDGHNYDEIANRLNLSRNTVKNHLVAAVGSIRTYLSKCGINPVILLAVLYFYTHK